MNIRGESIQNGEPTPEHPVEIENKTNLTGAIQILNKLKSKVSLVKADEKEYRLPFLMDIEKQAIETVLEELENKQDDINILQAQRDSMEYQFNQAISTLEHKDLIINLMALDILNYDDQLVINKYKDINDVKETFEEILKEELYD